MIILTKDSVYRNPITGEILSIRDLPKDLKDMITGQYYIIGDYVYQYVGIVSSVRKIDPGSIFRIGKRFKIKDYETEKDKLIYHTSNVCDKHSATRTDEEDVDKLFEEYISSYNSGDNLMVINRDKVICSGEIFIPEVDQTDDPLKIITKLMIAYLKVPLNNFRQNFDKEYSLDNLRSALIGTTKNMSINKFLDWCDLLTMDWEFTLEDMNPDVMNPLKQKIVVSNYNMPYIDVDTIDKGIFTVGLDDGEDPLKRCIKLALAYKKINIKDYRHRGTTPHLINNMKSALKSKQKMTLPYFLAWCEILDIRYTMKIYHPKTGIWYKAEGYTITSNAKTE